jgi:hypothetical protein
MAPGRISLSVANARDLADLHHSSAISISQAEKTLCACDPTVTVSSRRRSCG